MLNLSHIQKIYKVDDQDFYALKDVSLSFPGVQFVSILGPSGCGKTTLLNLIGCLDTPTSGEIISDRRNLSTLNEKEKDSYRNNNIGFVFQNCYLIPQLSVLDNVKIALSVRDYSKKECEEKAIEALKLVHMDELKNKKPNQLSGGQQQKVAIARALVTSPSYILADEPTGALDSISSKEVMNLLKEISKTKLVIMVTHNEELASTYSDRIIKMKDGSILSDTVLHERNDELKERKEEHSSHLSFMMALRLAFRNIRARKGKTILSAIANSFGMIGIAFLLAINNGFEKYSYTISNASATSLPIVITNYTEKTDKEAFDKTNQSITYPDVEEIYPSVSHSTNNAYQYNNVTQRYLNYLEAMKKENLISDYVMGYSSSYNFNLSTEFPKSIDGETSAYRKYVNTTITNYNSYASNASLPYNIFHVLYGDTNQYDLLAGNLPEDENDLVLVVDKYNAVKFKILRALGFYNAKDTEKDVKDQTLTSKVKPISFKDVIGKEYKIFNNDEVYTENGVRNETDAIGHSRTISYFKKRSLSDDFYNNNGRTLKICGILRPKQSTAFSILSPSLCYSQKLQDLLMPENTASNVATKIKDNIVFAKPNGLTGSVISAFTSDLDAVLQEYYDSGSSVLPTSKLNDVFKHYFHYYPIDDKEHYYEGFSTFFYTAKNLGTELIGDELKGKDLSKKEEIDEQLENIKKDFLTNIEQAYNDIISLVGYCNAYSTIQSLVIFPSDLEARTTILNRLDEYNNIQDDENHARCEEEQIYYVTSDSNHLIDDVSEMIKLASVLLIIFAIISLVASSAMTSLMISNTVLERKKEIGLLRSFGTRKSNVILLFELEAVFIGLLGGVVGSISTALLSIPINHILRSFLSYYHLNNICNFTFPHALIIIAFSLLIGVVSALIPSFKASKVSPVESLRSE